MGLSKLWGKDSSGARGFVFSHVKSIYYNWSQKKLLSTKLDEIDESISSLNSRMKRRTITLTESSDLNDCTDIYAMYRIDAGITPPINSPGAGFSVYPIETAWGTFQIAIYYSENSSIMFRNYFNGNWGDWKTILTS